MSAPETPSSKITAHYFEALLADQVPMAETFRITAEALGWGRAELRLHFHEIFLRPGGIMSGPAIMTLADTALFAAILTQIGEQPLTLTSDLSVRFLRPAPPGDLFGDARVLKLGRRLAVGEVFIRHAERKDVAAHATGTYVVPSS